MENLHSLLRDHNTSDPLWFGCKYIHPDLRNGFPQGTNYIKTSLIKNEMK
jgi:hypothetical protein